MENQNWSFNFNGTGYRPVRITAEVLPKGAYMADIKAMVSKPSKENQNLEVIHTELILQEPGFVGQTRMIYLCVPSGNNGHDASTNEFFRNQWGTLLEAAGFPKATIETANQQLGPQALIGKRIFVNVKHKEEDVINPQTRQTVMENGKPKKRTQEDIDVCTPQDYAKNKVVPVAATEASGSNVVPFNPGSAPSTPSNGSAGFGAFTPGGGAPSPASGAGLSNVFGSRPA